MEKVKLEFKPEQCISDYLTIYISPLTNCFSIPFTNNTQQSQAEANPLFATHIELPFPLLPVGGIGWRQIRVWAATGDSHGTWHAV